MRMQKVQKKYYPYYPKWCAMMVMNPMELEQSVKNHLKNKQIQVLIFNPNM